MMNKKRYSVVYTEICGIAIVSGCELAAFNDLTAATAYFEASLTSEYTVEEWIDYIEILLMENKNVIRRSAV